MGKHHYRSAARARTRIERFREEVFPRLAIEGKTENARLLRFIDKFGELTQASLDSSHVAEFRDLRRKKGASPQTVKHEIGLLGRILKVSFR